MSLLAKFRILLLSVSALLTAFTLSFVSFPVSAHTFHTSFTKIDYNSQTKSAEFTVRVFTHDLEAALEKRIGKKVRLDKAKDIKGAVESYIDENVSLKQKDGEKKKLTFVGYEQETDTVFVYLEVKMPDGLSETTLQNTLFLELNDDQVNLILVKEGDKKADLLFKANDKDFKKIEFKKSSDLN